MPKSREEWRERVELRHEHGIGPELGLLEFPEEPARRGQWGWGGRYRNAMRTKDPCSYCGRQLDRRSGTWDHVEPRRGTPDNVVRACAPCNHEKGATSLAVWLAYKAWWRAHGKPGRKSRKRLRALGMDPRCPPPGWSMLVRTPDAAIPETPFV